MVRNRIREEKIMENNRFRSSVMCDSQCFASESLPIMVDDMANEMAEKSQNT